MDGLKEERKNEVEKELEDSMLYAAETETFSRIPDPYFDMGPDGKPEWKFYYEYEFRPRKRLKDSGVEPYSIAMCYMNLLSIEGMEHCQADYNERMLRFHVNKPISPAVLKIMKRHLVYKSAGKVGHF